MARRDRRRRTHTGTTGQAVSASAGEHGWLGVGWPREYGGQGRSMIEQTIFYHELDLHDVHYGNLTITSLAMTLIKLASEEQKHEYLPRILKGELEICLGYTEPGAGSGPRRDHYARRTRRHRLPHHGAKCSPPRTTPRTAGCWHAASPPPTAPQGVCRCSFSPGHSRRDDTPDLHHGGHPYQRGLSRPGARPRVA
ncbi:MAG: acyl-CoA dehydrogenase family protein [Gammaproteobacteria bacterium]|nr:acyl-CoA dehydrogenase family protein [Gammaproteobacteria bacterium]